MLGILDISAAGMHVEMARINVIAGNLANAQSVYKPGESGYVPKKLVSTVRAATFDGIFQGEYAKQTSAVTETQDVAIATRVVHDPSHPLADMNGDVVYPNVNALDEMLGLMAASRVYESNVQVFNATKTMIQKALQIGAVR